MNHRMVQRILGCREAMGFMFPSPALLGGTRPRLIIISLLRTVSGLSLALPF